MKSVLFVINRPSLEQEVEYDKWAKSVTIVSNAAMTNKAVLELTLGFWQIDVNGGLSFLSLGILECEKTGLDYSVLFLEKNQTWMKFSPKDKTTSSF